MNTRIEKAQLVGEIPYLQFGENIEEHQKLIKSDETLVVYLYACARIHYAIKVVLFLFW